ncbi:hypothetical protein ACFXPA_31380 [Amycolatopsis sp. NPDC059090]|uniref:hypothetical protein n=1 Tax=Amycolatopsis sp. NPDC059090 TaxID=3346723 RepID=UPI0036724A6E
MIIRHICTVGVSDRENKDVLSEDFWPNLDIDLSGASLDELDLVFCECRSLTLDRATVAGELALDGTCVQEKLSCERTVFQDNVGAYGLRPKLTTLQDATLDAGICMTDSKTGAALSFAGAEVRKHAVFLDCAFGYVNFSGCTHQSTEIRFKDCTVVIDENREAVLPAG